MQQKSVLSVALAGVLILALIAVAPVSAHSPSNIVLSYDSAAGTLAATITHNVTNPATHYIKEVRITINGVSVVDTQYASQPTNGTFTYTYPLQATAGSTIALRAECNLEGEMTTSLVVGGANATPTLTPTMTASPTETETMTMTMTTVATTMTTVTTPPTTAPPATTAQAPGFALWAGMLAFAAGGIAFVLRR